MCHASLLPDCNVKGTENSHLSGLEIEMIN